MFWTWGWSVFVGLALDVDVVAWFDDAVVAVVLIVELVGINSTHGSVSVFRSISKRFSKGIVNLGTVLIGLARLGVWKEAGGGGVCSERGVWVEFGGSCGSCGCDGCEGVIAVLISGVFVGNPFVFTGGEGGDGCMGPISFLLIRSVIVHLKKRISSLSCCTIIL